MIISVTGGAGFIGRQLALHHLAQGHEVRILSRKKEIDPRARLYLGDLSLTEVLRQFVDGAHILYHCAGEVRNESHMHAVHVAGTDCLIKAASGRIGRWVQLSSVGAYGPQRVGIVTEATKSNPIGVYETTKVESDELVKYASAKGAFENVILRPSNVFGTEMTNQSLYGLMKTIQQNRFFFIGKVGAFANYIHVDNVVAALVLCSSHKMANGNLYNLSDQVTLEHFVAVIANELEVPQPNIRLPEWLVRGVAGILGRVPSFPLTSSRVNALTGRATYSIEKIQQELGYGHVIPMEAGLKKLVRAWKSRTAI